MSQYLVTRRRVEWYRRSGDAEHVILPRPRMDFERHLSDYQRAARAQQEAHLRRTERRTP